MGLFGFGKKKKNVSAFSSAPQVPKVITRSSTYGPIIDYEKPQDLPRDAELLYRTGLAYWNGAFGPNLTANMDVCRQYAVQAFNALYYFGLEEQHPEAGFYIAKYFWRKSGDVNGVTIDYKKCAAHMCRHFILNGPEVNHIQEPILLYLKHFPDGMDQVIQWLRERVDKDRLDQAEPVGLIMLRHYLLLNKFASEVMEPSDPAPYLRLAEKYLLGEAVVQHVSCLLLYNDIYKKEHTTKDIRRMLKSQSNHGNTVAAQILYGVGIDRIPYEYDGRKTSDSGQVWMYSVGQYKHYYEVWNKALPALKQKQAAFDPKWFAQEADYADKKAALAAKRHEARQHIAGQYARALYLYARGRTEEAIPLMKQVEDADASFNWEAMQRYFCVTLSPAATGWLSRHKSHIRQYEIDEDGNYVELTSSPTSPPSRAVVPSWDVAESMADRIREAPSAEGYRQLARLIGQRTPYWEPLQDLSRQIRQDVLAEEGLDGLIWYLLDEPYGDCEDYAQALIYDPETNHGDEQLMEIGWLALVNYRFREKKDALSTAIDYVNRYFDCPDAFADSGLNIRYVTQLAAKDDEKALHVLGELYVDFEEINHGNELLVNVGQVFYARLSKLYKEKYKALKAHDERVQFLLDWYQMEHVDRHDADDSQLDYICFIGAGMDIPFFYHTLTRKNVYQWWMEHEGRAWIKARLKVALDAGYKSVADLYNQMDKEDEARELALQREEEFRKKALEEELARDKERRRQAFNDRCDDLERMADILRGGSGLTSEERALAGLESYVDHLRNKEARDRLTGR